MSFRPRRGAGENEPGDTRSVIGSFWLADVSIRQPVFITMLVLAVIVVGVVSYGRMGLDLFPDVSLPVVVVQTVYPGANPADVEQTVSEPIEDAVSSLNGVDTVRSTSTNGASLVTIEFAMDQDPKAAADSVRARLSTIQNSLPSDAQDPVVETFDPSAAPILSIAIADASGKRSPEQLRSFVDDALKPAVEQVAGVAAVNVTGGQTAEIHVDLRRGRLQKYGLSPDRVVQAIQAANLSVPAGQVPNGQRDATLRTTGAVQSSTQLANVTISTPPNGAAVQVRDVASVTAGTADVQSISRLDGRSSVIAAIQKRSGTNTVQVADAVKQKLAALQQQYPDLSIAVAFDQSTYTRESIDDLQQTLLLGALLAALVVLAFFHDLRNTLVTVAGLPVILLGTVALLHALGVTLNTISMLAISLSIGMLIDDAIVVRENIYRHVELGEPPPVAASRGAAEIAPAVFAVTATIVAVFLPIAFTEGIAGKFLRDFGLTVAIAVLISLIESFTLAPMLSAHFFKSYLEVPSPPAPSPSAQERGERPIASRLPSPPVGEGPGERGRPGVGTRVAIGYRQILDWSLHHRPVVALVAVASLIAAGVLFTHLAFSFVPSGDQGQFTVSLDLAPGTPLADADRQARAIEAVLRDDSAVQHIFTTVGSSAGSSNSVSVVVTLRKTGQTPRIVQHLRPRIQAAIPGVPFTIDLQSSTAALGGGAAASTIQGRPIQFAVQGQDPVAVDRASVDLVKRLRAIPGAIDVGDSLKPGAPGLDVVLDPARAAKAGVTAAQVGATVRAMVNGESAGTLHTTGQDYDIVVRLAEADRQNAVALLQMPIVTAQGTTVPLSDLGQLVQTTEPGEIDRENRQRQVIVGADSLGRSHGVVLADAQAAVSAMPLPPGVTIQASGQAADTSQMFGALGLAMGLAVLFVYMILASLFGSFVQPFVIMLALPFSLVGALFAIFIVGVDFDMLGMIGVILLMGLVTKNSILLVDLANRLRRQGVNAREAMLVAGPIRLRPILMTTLAMIGGMMPVAAGVGAGAEVRRPMGVTVIGGLLTSTLLTLVVVPVAYSLVADLGRQITTLGDRLAQPGSGHAILGFARGAGVWVLALGLLGVMAWRAGAVDSGQTATPAPRVAVARPTATALASIPLNASPPPATTPARSTPPPHPSGEASVGNTDGLGLNLRGAPGIGQPLIASLPDGARLEQLGDPTPASGHVWIKVRDSLGRVGWVAQDYLVTNGR